MTDRPKSRRIRIIASEPVPVHAGRGLIEYPPGWTGPAPAEVADYLEARPHLAEVWRDGEPAAPEMAPGSVPGREIETAVRVVQTDDGPRFTDIDEREPPPFEGEEEAG